MHLPSLNTNVITEVICDISGNKPACQKTVQKWFYFFPKQENVWLEFFLTNCLTYSLISLSLYVEITMMAWKYLECEHYRIMQLWSWMWYHIGGWNKPLVSCCYLSINLKAFPPQNTIILTLWGPTSSYARQCVPLHEVQHRAQLDTLHCYAFCRFQEAHAIYYVLYELLGG